MAADVVGYSRLMGLDEEGTLKRLTSHLSDLIEPEVERHNGRVVKTTGDGLLVEFASVVDAVQCAMLIQTNMKTRNADEPGDRQTVFRIGINLGDIIVQDGDVFGDGVNVAARLEGLADPGGICISRSARDQVRDRLDCGLEDLGEIDVKNIARPVRVFRILPDGAPKQSAGSTSPRPARGLTKRLSVAAAALLFAAAGLAFWQPWGGAVETASLSRMKFPLPDKPSVAVLPFKNLSEDPKHQLLTDAITEDVTSNLARISGLFVIARNSTNVYKDKPVTVQQAAEDLGVRHIVQGSVRRSNDRIRVNAQLIDAVSGHNIWSDRFDREIKDIFALQDEITQSIVTELAVNMAWVGGGKRLTNNIEAYFVWLAAQRETLGTSPKDLAHALSLGERAIQLDPDFSRGYALLAYAHTQRGYFGYVKDRQTALQRGLVLARKAVEISDNDWYAHFVLGQAMMNTRDYKGAIGQFDRAITLEPANAKLLAFSALPLTFLGRADEAIARVETSMRLNPFYDWVPTQLLGQALYLKERYEESAKRLEEAAMRNPKFIGNLWWRSAAYAKLGRIDEAHAVAKKLLEARPDSSISTAFIKISDPAAMDRLRDGWRKAGIPD